MKRIPWLGCAAVALAAGTAHAQSFRNPVFGSEDPAITRVNNTYYYSESCGVGSAASAAHGICLRTSKTLEGLATAKSRTVWTSAKDTDPNGSEIWAPEVHYIDGTWYIYYTADNGNNDNHRLFLLSSAKPGGPYKEVNTGQPHGQLLDSTGNWAIDPDIFTGADDKLYLTWSCGNQKTSAFPQRICLAPMSGPASFAGPTVYLSNPDQYWETRTAPIDEGPVGYVRNGRTYITFSASASWMADDYASGVLTLAANKSPLNAKNWKKSGPILDRHGSAYGTGSVVFTPSPDGRETFVLYHGIDSTAAPCDTNAWSCRDVRMQRVYFDANGYPVIGYPANPGVEIPSPSGEGGNTGGTDVLPDWASAWGDAAEGNASAGQVVGNWSFTDGAGATSDTGGAWDQLFSPTNPNPENVSVHVEAKLLRKGTTQSYPKYGAYCSYSDTNNHAEFFIDPVYNVLATHAVVAGQDRGWQNTALPGGFDATKWHALDCSKSNTTDTAAQNDAVPSAATYTFTVDAGTGNAVHQTRTLDLINGQPGLIVVDIAASYRNLKTTAN